MAVGSTTGGLAGAPEARTFFGHPIGLAYLSFAEAWERFSYYGMQALLVLYMTQFLLLPGHVEHVAGFATFRGIVEGLYGRLSPGALASAIFGFYAGGVYLTPIAGGFLADRVLGRTATVTIGAILMALGHFLMAFEVSFLPALACLLIGVGCFKGNIASQVGELYAPGDLRRADAFQIYLMGIQVAVIVSPLVCGTLGQKVAWHWGFGAAGVGMVIGLAIYLAGRRHLPRDIRAPKRTPKNVKTAHVGRPKLAPGESKTVLVLVPLLPVLALSAIGNLQIFNAYLIWGDANYDLEFFGETMPVTWLISLDAFISAGTIAASVAFWRWWATKHREPDEIVKVAIGSLIGATGPLVLAAASTYQAASGHKIGLVWGLGFHILNDIGFSNILPVGLALFSRASPRAIGGLMIGVYYLHLFLANWAVGWLGGLLEKMSAVSFWLLHAGLVGGAGVLLFGFAHLFGHILAPTVDPEAARSMIRSD